MENENTGSMLTSAFHFKQDFVVQGGDPTGTGRGGSSIWGFVVSDVALREVARGPKALVCL
jgi:cyclophilin family peptidyl-prolyl cis-trans isomerase